MRRAVIAGGALAALAVAFGGWTYAHPAPEPLAPPALSWTQTADHVYVHVRNDNRTWGLRDQPVVVRLHRHGYYVLVVYRPGQARPLPGGGTFDCCMLDLPPGATVTLTLPPQDVEVEGVAVEMRGGAGWQAVP